MAKKIKTKKIVPSEVVKPTEKVIPPKVEESMAAQTVNNPAPKSSSGNSALKIGLGICLGCLILTIIVVVGIFVTGGLAIKNIGIPFLKKAVEQIKPLDSINKLNEGKKGLEGLPTNGIIRQETTLPEDFPSDFPIYPNSEMKVFSGDGVGQKGYLVNLKTNDTPVTVAAFYESNLVTSGWQITHRLTADQGTILTINKADQNGAVTINYSKEENKTLINIVLSNK